MIYRYSRLTLQIRCDRSTCLDHPYAENSFAERLEWHYAVYSWFLHSRKRHVCCACICRSGPSSIRDITDKSYLQFGSNLDGISDIREEISTLKVCLCPEWSWDRFLGRDLWFPLWYFWINTKVFGFLLLLWSLRTLTVAEQYMSYRKLKDNLDQATKSIDVFENLLTIAERSEQQVLLSFVLASNSWRITSTSPLWRPWIHWRDTWRTFPTADSLEIFRPISSLKLRRCWYANSPFSSCLECCQRLFWRVVGAYCCRLYSHWSDALQKDSG